MLGGNTLKAPGREVGSRGRGCEKFCSNVEKPQWLVGGGQKHEGCMGIRALSLETIRAIYGPRGAGDDTWSAHAR